MRSITRTHLFRAAVAVIALHVARRQLPPARSRARRRRPPRQRARSARPARRSRPGAIPRLRGGRRARSRCFSAPLGLAAGIEAVLLRAARSARRATTSPACSRSPPACCCSASAPRRSGGRAAPDASRAWRYARRALLARRRRSSTVAALVFPIGPAYVDDPHRPRRRARRPPRRAQRGRHARDQRRAELEGWYVPSRNGAAVIAFPGRKSPQRHARMLARHGYGVLLFDRRGEGRSDGDPNAFGWGGEARPQRRRRLPAVAAPTSTRTASAASACRSAAR